MKKKITPPAFLQERIHRDVASMVKRRIKPFLDQVPRDEDGQLPPGSELLRLFLAYMGRTSSRFRNIHDESISTNKWEGMSQIYEMVRKKAYELRDEKHPEPPKASPKSKEKKTPPKNQSAKKAETNGQARAQPESPPPKDQETVRIEGHGQHHGHDEKAVDYRQRLASDVEHSVSSPPSPSEYSIASRSILGKR